MPLYDVPIWAMDDAPFPPMGFSGAGWKLTAPEVALELDAVVEAVKAVPWTALQELKGNSELLKIEDAEAMFSSLRKALS